MNSIFKGIGRYLGSGFIKKTIAYAQIFLQILLSTLPLYSMSFSTQANSDITKKTVLFKRLYTLTPTDTLESVASNYGLSVDELWALNINLYNNRSAFDAVKYGAVVYIPNQEEEQQATQQASMVASHLSQVGNSLSSEDRVGAFSRLAKGMLLSSTAKTVEEWLGHIGQAQVKLQADDKNDFSGSEVDLFIPLYDQPEKLAFSQFGFRRIDQRNIMNIGLGQRHYVSDWMFGYNIFFDQQISGNAHRRVGFGGELARDYVKLSANSYHRLGGWKNSTRLEDYDERAANGYDIRTEAYLPHYPQLGGKLMYEQYFGDEVALFGINERQKNPSALTAGVSYTPIPLVSLGLDHTIGNGGKKKTGVNVAVNYEINTPWQKQIDPAAVQATRTLAGSRMDLVDRNNNIVLEYRKQQVVTLNLPEKISGKEALVLPINYTFNARHGLDRIEWDAADVILAGGQVSDRGNLAYHVALPPYIDGAANAYVLSGRAVDKKGNYSTSSSTNIYVTGVNISSVNSVSSLTPPTLPADTTSHSILQLALKTDAGKAVGGVARNITFAVRDVSGNVPRVRSLPQPVMIGEAQEIQPGVYETTVTSGSSVGRFEITPTVRGVQLNPLILTQAADATTAMIHSSGSVTISTPSITTNTADKTRLEVQVTDAFGHPVPGVEVTWVSDLNSPGLEHVTSITNEHGIAENNFSSTVTGTANITVQVGTSTPVAAGAIEIKTDNSTMTVKASDFTVTTTSVVANGTDKTVYKLKVTDKQGNAVPAAAVEWSNNIGIFIQASPTTTDANGETFIELASTKAGTAKVTATIGGKPYHASDVTFIASRQSAQIALLPASKIKAAANDKDWITLTAKIVDAHNNPIKSEKIVWDAVSHQMTFSPTTKITHTNDQGESEIQVASAQVGDASVSAQVVANDLLINQDNQTLTFSADAATAGISKWLAPGDQALIANGVATVSYTVLVKDSKDHIVPNSQVLWETDLGKFTSSQTMKTVTTTDSQGEATVELASTQAGFAKVKAAVNGGSITSTAKVEFTADSSTATIAITPVNKQVYVANGGDTVTYNVIVLDKHQNPVRDADITWSTVNHHVVKYSPASSKTDSDGKATVAVTSTAAGSTQVQATLANNATAIADQISFNADRQTAVIKTVVVKGNNQPAPDGSGSVSYVTTVEDINGNPVSGMILSWGSNINKVTNQTTTTDANGMSTQTITGTQAGKVEVSVALNEGNNAKNPVKSINEAEFVAVAPVNAKSSLLLLPNLIIADGKQNATLKFTLRDDNHNPVSGLANQIKVTQVTANYVTVGAIAETTVKGVYEAEIKGTKEGSVDLTATVTGYNSVSKTQTLTLQADNRTATLKSVTSDIKTAAADGTTSITYTASVIDAKGNASLADVSVGWRTNLGKLVAMSKTNASGMATITLTSKQAGKATVTAIVSSSSQMDAAPVTFTAGGIVTAQSSASVSAANLVADGVTTTKVTVKVNDLNGNPLAGHSDKIKVTADNFPGLTLPTQFIEGPTGVYTATITGTKAGEGKIVTTLAGKELAKHTLKVIADKSSAKIAEVKPLQSGSIAVGDKVTYQAVIKDAHDNPLGADIPVHWSVNRDTLMSSTTLTSLTNSAGVAEMEISRDVQGDALVTATVNNHSLQATAVNFSSGGVDIKASSVTLIKGNNIIANNLDVATIQVDIRDSKGNPLPNLAGQITTSPTHGYKKLEIETKANSLGGYLVTIKGTQAGKYPVTISVNGNPLPDTANVELVGDRTTAQLLSVDVNKTTFKANDVDQVIYTAKVIDKHDNPLGNYQVAWSLAQGAGTYDVQSYTNKMGIAETSLKANRLGEYKMDVWVRGNKNSAPSVNSTAGDMDPSHSDFVVDVARIDASGNTKAKLTVTLKDKFGNLLVGQQVSIRDVKNFADINITPAIMIDNNNGTYSAEVSATKKGKVNFIASIHGIDLIQQPELKIVNIIPQLSFANQNVAVIYTSKTLPAQKLNTGALNGLKLNWSSDNSDVAKFNANGEIELLKAGIVTITAETQANNTYSRGVASYQLEVERADPKLKFQQSIQKKEWDATIAAYQPVAENADANIAKLTLNWEINDSAVATIDARNGEITTKKPNTTQVTVKSAQDDRFNASVATYALVVEKKLFPIKFNNPIVQSNITDKVSLQSPSGASIPNIVWSYSDGNVLTVDPNGSNLKVKNPGRVELTAKVAGSDYYLASSESYAQEIYGKPEVKIDSTDSVSKSSSNVDSNSWNPTFVGDKLILKWSNVHSDSYRKPHDVSVEIYDVGNRKELDTRHSVGDTVEVAANKDWIGKTVKFIIKPKGFNNIEGTYSHSREIKIGSLKPHEIWSDAQLMNYIEIREGGQKVSNGICGSSWNPLTYYVRLDTKFEANLGGNTLLWPMEYAIYDNNNLIDQSASNGGVVIRGYRDLSKNCSYSTSGTVKSHVIVNYLGDNFDYKHKNEKVDWRGALKGGGLNDKHPNVRACP
ncbi:putative adhesin [Yersinia aldovae]|uniref:inverse autotransporter beta-barrel domain-containing protein n=1 Tax=Yersinia aldovae TaxID=29483 RepID=UPI0005DD9426|nr:inverse autotransporter beta-barrel domain-containing protein [Yersinia aldovae]CNJ72061.1 putative adhesin [Yersinia aldovae]